MRLVQIIGQTLVASPLLVDLRMRALMEMANDPLASSTAMQLEVNLRDEALSMYFTQRTQATTRSAGNAEVTDSDQPTSYLTYLENKEEAEAVKRIHSMFTTAFQTSSDPALLHLMYSQFCGDIARNKHLEHLHLKYAGTTADDLAIDVAFFVHEREKVHNVGTQETLRGQMTLTRRIRFEDLRTKANTLVTTAREVMAEFWDALAVSSPDAE
ncbi:hypothetical protein EON67_09610, partial [archaeon]